MKRLILMATSLTLSAILSACHNNTKTSTVSDPVKASFEAEMPASAVSVSLYASPEGTHACDVNFKNGTITTAPIPVPGLPDLVSYSRNGTEARSADVTADKLRPAIRGCFTNAKTVVEFKHALKQ